MQQVFYGRDPADTQQQALAQQERYVQQANLVAGRADQQMAQDNAFAFQARNQLANEELQRFQFARQDEARAQEAAIQNRNFFANQAQNRAQESRLDAQGRRDEEKLRFDMGRVQQEEKLRRDNSGFLTDAFAKAIGHTQSELDKTETALRDRLPEYERLTTEGANKGYVLDKFGNFIPRNGPAILTNPAEAAALNAFQAKANPILAAQKQLTEVRNLWETKRHDLEAQGMRDRLFVAGNRDTGIEVFDGFTGVRKQAVPAPAARPAAPIGIQQGLQAELSRLSPTTSPAYGKMLKERIVQAGLTGQISREAAAQMIQAQGLDRF